MTSSAPPSPAPAFAWPSLLAFLGLSYAVAFLGSQATFSSVGSWYTTLQKPAFNPPNWVFGPVWTLLYAWIAFAGWRLWERRRRPGGRPALIAWGVQLALNLGWSLLFFGLRSPALGLADIALLLAAIVATMLLAWRVCRIAALLLLPYLAWVSFAALLNFEIWRLN